MLFAGSPEASGHSSTYWYWVSQYKNAYYCLDTFVCAVSAFRWRASVKVPIVSRKVSVACDKKATFVTLIKARQSKTLSLRCMHGGRKKQGSLITIIARRVRRRERLILHALLSHTCAKSQSGDAPDRQTKSAVRLTESSLSSHLEYLKVLGVWE